MVTHHQAVDDIERLCLELRVTSLDSVLDVALGVAKLLHRVEERDGDRINMIRTCRNRILDELDNSWRWLLRCENRVQRVYQCQTCCRLSGRRCGLRTDDLESTEGGQRTRTSTELSATHRSLRPPPSQLEIAEETLPTSASCVCDSECAAFWPAMMLL